MDVRIPGRKPSFRPPGRVVGPAVVLGLLGLALAGWWWSLPPNHGVGAVRTAAPPDARLKCSGCGVVESTRIVVATGTAGGALVGGFLGTLLGGAYGRELLGAVGAYAGSAGAGSGSRERHETTIRFDNGSTRVFDSSTPPQWRAGDRVRVVDGAIRVFG